MVDEVETRINAINQESILGSGYVDQLISDNPNSPFPQVLRTERPDRLAANLLDGRVGLFIDGSPAALILPAPMVTFFQTMDEFNSQWIFGSLLRMLRWVGFIVAVFAPSIYIAVVSKNFDIVPTELLMKIAESRAGIPFPPLIEAVFMEITIEILREAGIRLPGRVGQTIGIVGAIVVGDAAVKAGIASNIMVVVVALTAIATFIMPVFEMGLTVRFIRFPMMILAGTFGLVGVGIGVAFVLGHLVALETCKVPYLEPFAPIKIIEWKDLFIRAPLKVMRYRPTPASNRNNK